MSLTDTLRTVRKGQDDFMTLFGRPGVFVVMSPVAYRQLIRDLSTDPYFSYGADPWGAAEELLGMRIVVHPYAPDVPAVVGPPRIEGFRS